MWHKGVRWHHVESDILKEGPGEKQPRRWEIAERKIVLGMAKSIPVWRQCDICVMYTDELSDDWVHYMSAVYGSTNLYLLDIYHRFRFSTLYHINSHALGTGALPTRKIYTWYDGWEQIRHYLKENRINCWQAGIYFYKIYKYKYPA